MGSHQSNITPENTSTMFVVTLHYLQPLAIVDQHLEAHRAYLAQQYANGTFLASGPQEPRTGGVILAQAESPKALQAALALDPFHMHGIAEYKVVQFTARMVAPGLERLMDA